MKETLRLIIPQWQGGSNSNYAFGADLLGLLLRVKIVKQSKYL